jgi:hypothetical protein
VATVNITAWDIAEKLGLVFVGEIWDDDLCHAVFKYNFHGKEIVDDLWYETTEDAKNSVAEELLRDIGKYLAGIID